MDQIKLKFSFKNRLDKWDDFESQTPTIVSATHAFSTIRGRLQNRILRESNHNFDIPRIHMIN